MFAQIAYHRPETLAFEKYYYELSTYPVPLEYIKERFAKTMERTKRPAFLLPAKYSKNNKDTWFAFKMHKKTEGHSKYHVYYFDRVVTDKIPQWQYDPDKDYDRWWVEDKKKRLTV